MHIAISALSYSMGPRGLGGLDTYDRSPPIYLAREEFEEVRPASRRMPVWRKWRMALSMLFIALVTALAVSLRSYSCEAWEDSEGLEA